MADEDVQSGIWRVGMLLEASYLPQLRNNPMKLIKPVSAVVSAEDSAGCQVVAVCKQGLLQTYQYVNEYVTPNPSGCLLHSVESSACKYPAVLVASLADQLLDFEDIFQQLNINNLKELHVSTGFSQTSEPTIILASQHFMECYGFFTREPVWFRWFNPSLLTQVMLCPTGPMAQHVIAEASQVIGQLYDKAEKEPVIMQQNFKFVFRASLTFDPTAGRTHEAVLSFQVLECSPVLQGRVTRETVFTFLPPPIVTPRENELTRSRRSTREEGKSHLESAASASSLGEEESERDEYVIEVVSVASFKLQSQYIVLPKETAKKHGIHHCQNVMIEAAPQKTGKKRATPTLSDVTVPLCITDGCGHPLGKQSHMVIAFLYEDEFELERYIPPSSLGLDYDTSALTLAYIHPQLLFFLFPETLSPTLCYYLRVKRAREALPAAKMIQLAEVSMPDSLTQEITVTEQLDHSHPVFTFFDQRSVLLNVGEVFKLQFDTGSICHYKICSLDPHCNGAATVDAHSSWECFLKPNKTHSYVSDIVPPSVLGPEPSFFSSISPPGLEEYADTLFSFFLPAFRAVSATQPHRSPSVLLTGMPGIGKKTLVKAVARRCRMHVIDFNCYEFTSDSVPLAEKKMTSDLNTGTCCDPVVIILSNVHMLGRKNILQEEPRISAIFEVYMATVNTFNSANHYPVLVVGVTSKPNLVPSRIQSCFLHQLEMSAPNQAQRLDMLGSLSKQYNLGLLVDLPAIAQATAGYVLGDLVNLLTQAFNLAVKDTYSHCAKSKSCNSEAIAISGVLMKQCHLNSALAHLQTMHSDSLGAPKIPDVRWEDVGGLGEAKKEILDTIQVPLLYPDLFGSGLRRSGVLLYGAPGTGKTLLAKAVATECSLNFLSVKGPELINMYVGQSEENIREVFDRARRCSPSVIFFDELDSIAPNRGRSGDSGGVMDRVVSQLLAELDGLHKAKDVFIIGATNRPDLIDPALLRPGRLDRLVYLGVNDDANAREKILQAITRKFQLAPDVDLEAVAKKCPGHLTGADLYSLCSDAMLTALRKKIHLLETGGHADEGMHADELQVEQSDFLSALQSLTPSITAAQLEEYKKINTKMTVN